MLYSKNTQILLHASLVPQVGPAVIFKILKKLLLDNNLCSAYSDPSDFIGKKIEIDLEVLYRYSAADFEKKFEISQKQAELLEKILHNDEALDTELFLLEKNGIKIICIFDDFYPECLRHIHCPPVILYYSGRELSRDFRGFAIVGSRDADDYARQTIQNIVPTLVLNKWQIVSGGAVGADTMAHKAALDAGGQTVAVLGSGLLRPYPEDNINLFKIIAEKGGTVISPFSLNTEPDRWHFPSRNRIISGLSQGCLVVQAAARSGALITAHDALDQGRAVFAVPGRIDDKLSVGCNKLIKQGAMLVCDVNDILEEFGEGLPGKMFKPAVKIQELQSSISDADNQDIVLCKLGAVLSIDELLVKTGLDLYELQDRLFQLQLEGKVRQTFTGAWEKCK